MKSKLLSRLACLCRAVLGVVLTLSTATSEAAFPGGSDSFSGATEIIATNDPSLSFEHSAFTAESGEPAISGNLAKRSAWWKWTAPGNGFVIIETIPPFDVLGANITIDPSLAAYTGTSVSNLTLVAQNLNFRSPTASRITFPTVAGQQYRIKLDADTTFTVGLAQIQLRFYERRTQSYSGVVFVNYERGGQALVSLSLTAAGTYTGKIQTGGKTYPFSGVVSADAQIVLGMPGAPLEKPVLLEIDLAELDAQSGTLSVLAHDGTTAVSSALFAKKIFSTGQPAPVAGYYTGFVETTRTGYYTGKVSPTGSVKIAGKTGDGAPFSAAGNLTVSLSASQFAFPFQATMFGGKGFLIGGLRFTDGAQDGIDSGLFLNRYLRPTSTGIFLPAGVKASVTLPGRKYTPPLAGQRAASFLNGTNGMGVFAVTAAPGEIAGFSENITLTPANAFVFASQARKPVLKLNPKTGLVTGTIREPAGVPRKLSGVLVSNGPLALRGFVSGATATANFEVKP